MWVFESLLLLAAVVSVFVRHNTASTSRPPASNTTHKDVVYICILLPYDDNFLFSLRRVHPVVDMAVARVKATLLRGVQVKVQYGDTDCNAINAPISAFENYKKSEVSTISFLVDPSICW